MDILRLYQSRPRSPQLEQECQRAYTQLKEERTRAFKLILPCAFIVAATSFRTRSILQICRNFIVMTVGGAGVNEAMAWNSLSAKLYLLLRANNNE